MADGTQKASRWRQLVVLVLVRGERCPEVKSGRGEARLGEEERQPSAGGLLQKVSGAKDLDLVL